MRHGESTSDIEDRFGGDYDDHLTEKGKEQAEKLAEKLLNKEIEIIFSSPKLRAKETAEILRESLGCNLEIVDNIREQNRYGVLTGMKKLEGKEKHPDQVELIKNPYNNAKDGEPSEPFRKRVIKAFNEITNSAYNAIAVISHGGPIRYLMREILGEDKLDHLEDCAVIEIQKDGDSLNISKMDGVF